MIIFLENTKIRRNYSNLSSYEDHQGYRLQNSTWNCPHRNPGNGKPIVQLYVNANTENSQRALWGWAMPCSLQEGYECFLSFVSSTERHLKLFSFLSSLPTIDNALNCLSIFLLLEVICFIASSGYSVQGKMQYRTIRKGFPFILLKIKRMGKVIKVLQ